MNCHDNKAKKHDVKGHGPMKHMLHMVLCCGIPVLLIFALPFIASISPGAAGVLRVITPFICPVMMIVMMAAMFGRSNKRQDCCGTDGTEQKWKDERNAE